MRTTFVTALFVTLLSVSLLGGCSGAGPLRAGVSGSTPTGSRATRPGKGVPALLQDLPALPAGREPSAIIETSRTGVQTFARSASALDVDPVLKLSSQPGTLSWAVWELPAVDELRFLDVQLSVTEPQGQGSVFLALADYSSGRWSLQGPAFGDRVLILDPLKHSSPGGAMYAAVLSYDGGEALVQKLSLLAFHSNAAPTANLQADQSSGDAPLSVSFDAAASTDPEGGALRYHWDFDGDGGFERLTFTPSTSFTYTGPGIFAASVAAEDSEGAVGTASLQINVNLAGNELPVAQFSTDVSSGNAPLLVSFDAALSSDADGSISRYDWDLDGDGVFELYDAGSALQHSYSGGGTFLAALRVTDNSGAQDTFSQAIDVNSPPLALLTVLPADPQIGDTFYLDAGGSSDPDGSIVLYEWDKDGDGSFEASSTGSLEPAAATKLGPFTLRLRLTDNEGATSTASAQLHVHGVQNTLVSDVGTPGTFSSLAEVNGRPAICFKDANSADLLYVRANDVSGSSWPAPVLLDSVGDSGFEPSMIVVNGRPAAAFARITSGIDLLYVRALDSDGASWDVPQIVDAANDTGLGPSLALVAGNPAIGYRNNTDQELRYVRALDSDGSSWGSPVVVDTNGNRGVDTSMLVVNGRPAQTYQDNSTGDLFYVRANDALGTSWGTPLTLDSNGFTGFDTSMAIVNGRPAVSYHNNTSLDLMFVRAQDADGSAWAMPQTLDSTGATGFDTSMAIIDGKPSIVCGNNDIPALLYFQALDNDGLSWSAPLMLDNSGFAVNPSMINFQGRAAVSYHQATNQELRFVSLF